MPKRNRVTPFGEIIAVPERGAFMGNRGHLHDSAGNLRRAWQLKRWIICVLTFRGRQRTVMAPGRYTELFFLDEATALAAGHRPCAECRHARFLDFCNAWNVGRREAVGSPRPTADEIDNRLHAERLTADRSKCTHTAALDKLPNGVFVTVPAWGEQAYLVRDNRLLLWSPGGYGESQRRPKGVKVTVLTPNSTVAVIRAGYTPDIHLSAAAPEEYPSVY